METFNNELYVTKEIDPRSERGYDGVEDQEDEESRGDRRRGEPINHQGSDECKYKTRKEGVDPRAEGGITSRPLCRKPSTHYLEWKIDQNNESQVFAFKTLLHHLERSYRFISSKPDLGNQVYHDKQLDIYIVGQVE